MIQALLNDSGLFLDSNSLSVRIVCSKSNLAYFSMHVRRMVVQGSALTLTSEVWDCKPKAHDCLPRFAVKTGISFGTGPTD